MRAEYAFNKYRKYFIRKVGDVGAGGSPIFFLKTGLNYTSIDVSNKRAMPDILYEFENLTIPVNNREFDTVLCMDVLEHTDDPYYLFEELCRISNRYVIISLPNNWVGYFLDFIRGRNESIGYGLPEEKPNTGIRHKWYFNLEHAEKFLKFNAKKNKFSICELDFVFDPNNNLIRFLWYPKINYLTDERIRDIIGDEVYRKKIGIMAPVVSICISLIGSKGTYILIKLFRVIFQTPFLLVDQILKRVIWGWGSKYRYLNLFCRQIWVVLERKEI